jgi:hypothetical protein
MSFEHKAEVLRRYQGYAIWGGAVVGGIASLIGAGPHFQDWSSPLATWGLIAAGCGAVGALVGYLFFSIVVGSQAGGGGVASGSDGEGASGDGGSSGGDGGGGGK